MSQTRRLAAILAADVAGYSRLMGADEEGTLERLKALRRELLDPKIAEYHGRIVKTTGDGMLVEFPSVVHAVRCAVEVQQAMPGRNTPLSAPIAARADPPGSKMRPRVQRRASPSGAAVARAATRCPILRVNGEDGLARIGRQTVIMACGVPLGHGEGPYTVWGGPYVPYRSYGDWGALWYPYAEWREPFGGWGNP